MHWYNWRHTSWRQRSWFAHCQFEEAGVISEIRVTCFCPNVLGILCLLRTCGLCTRLLCEMCICSAVQSSLNVYNRLDYNAHGMFSKTIHQQKKHTCYSHSHVLCFARMHLANFSENVQFPSRWYSRCKNPCLVWVWYPQATCPRIVFETKTSAQLSRVDKL